MDKHDLTEYLHFSADGARRTTLTEGAHLWSEVICLQQNQETGPMLDPDAEAMFLVLAGEVVVFHNKSRTRLSQWQTIVTPPDTKLLVRSASVDPSAVLVVTSPPPSSLADDEA